MGLGKSKYRDISDKQKKEALDGFYDLMSMVKSKDDMRNFLKDLLTPSESLMIARRIQIAKMLLQGRYYEDIRQELGVGSSTISNVDKWLSNGLGAYRKEIEKIKNKKKENKKIQGHYDDPFSFDGMRKRYPGHFALINMFLKD